MQQPLSPVIIILAYASCALYDEASANKNTREYENTMTQRVGQHAPHYICQVTLLVVILYKIAPLKVASSRVVLLNAVLLRAAKQVIAGKLEETKTLNLTRLRVPNMPQTSQAGCSQTVRLTAHGGNRG